MALPAVIKYLLIDIGGKFMLAKLKERLSRKLANSVKSSTVGVAAGIIAAGAWLQTHPDALAFLGEYQGVALAAVGLLVALARLRSL